MEEQEKEQKHKAVVSIEDAGQLSKEIFKKFLKNRLWKYKDFADAIGTSENTVSNWMSKKGEIPIWARFTILYMERLDIEIQEHTYSKQDIEETNRILSSFKSLVNRREEEEDG